MLSLVKRSTRDLATPSVSWLQIAKLANIRPEDLSPQQKEMMIKRVHESLLQTHETASVAKERIEYQIYRSQLRAGGVNSDKQMQFPLAIANALSKPWNISKEGIEWSINKYLKKRARVIQTFDADKYTILGMSCYDGSICFCGLTSNYPVFQVRICMQRILLFLIMDRLKHMEGLQR